MNGETESQNGGEQLPPSHAANGKFAPGNKAAAGHRGPKHKRILKEAVNDDMRRAIWQKLALLAMGGDVQAIKLFLAYDVGRPRELPPDESADAEDRPEPRFEYL